MKYVGIMIVVVVVVVFCYFGALSIDHSCVFCFLEHLVLLCSFFFRYLVVLGLELSLFECCESLSINFLSLIITALTSYYFKVGCTPPYSCEVVSLLYCTSYACR
jgi:hypothetical protein